MSQQKKAQIKIIVFNNNGDPFITTLHNVHFAPYLCNRSFSIIKLMNLGHICLFQKGFCMVYFGAKEKNAVTSLHIA